MVNKKNLVALCFLLAAQVMGAMNDQTKFYLKYGDKKEKITRNALVLSWLLDEVLEEQRLEVDQEMFDAELNTLTIDLSQYQIPETIKFEDILRFVKFAENTLELKNVKTEGLIPLIMLADRLSATTRKELWFNPARDLLKLLMHELADRIKDEDYLQFIDGKGVLWSIIDKIPEGPLKEELFPKREEPTLIKKYPFDSPIYALAGLPGGMLAVGLWSGTLVIWDCKKDKEFKKIKGTDPIKFLAVLPEGKLAVGSLKGIQISNWKKGKVLRRMKSYEEITSLLILSNDTFASGSSKGTIQIWDWKKGKELWNKKIGKEITALVKLSDDTIVLGSWDGTIQIWNWKKDEMLKRMEGDEETNSLLVLPDGTIVSGSRRGTISIWDWKDGKMLKKSMEGGERTNSLLILPDDTFASGSGKGTISFWDWKDGKMLKSIKSDSGTNSLSMLSDGTLASASWEKTIEIFEVIDFYVGLNGAQSMCVKALRVLANKSENFAKDFEGKVFGGNEKFRKIVFSLPPKTFGMVQNLGVFGLREDFKMIIRYRKNFDLFLEEVEKISSKWSDEKAEEVTHLLAGAQRDLDELKKLRLAKKHLATLQNRLKEALEQFEKLKKGED